MARELSAPQSAGTVGPQGGGFVGWLGRRLSGLWPRTRKQYAMWGVFLLLALFVLLEWRWTTSYSAQVVVTSDTGVAGINPLEDRLDFGDMPAGAGQTKHLTLENGGRIPTRVSIILTGDIRDLVSVSDAFFTLGPGDTKNVDFKMIVPQNAETTTYTGDVYIVRTPWVPWP